MLKDSSSARVKLKDFVMARRTLTAKEMARLMERMKD